jgi:hypothetical protein
MSTFAWKFSGLDTNANPWLGFEYWLLLVDGKANSAIPAAAVTPAYVPGVATVYTCDLTKLSTDTAVVGNPSFISTGTHTFAAAAVGGGVAGAAGPTNSVAYVPPNAVTPPKPPAPPVPAAPVASNAA